MIPAADWLQALSLIALKQEKGHPRAAFFFQEHKIRWRARF
jgi:hypothetical protein